ncbi:MAG: demethoxyubiquinone hydroxylase family protein, partial [Pseudomonadota bacterium]|nr:demethoxyubiquinone hydroxylase family protein [Pseudomonadota bacterium]
DEAEHRQTALDAGAEETPGYEIMTRIIRLGCRAAIRASERY